MPIKFGNFNYTPLSKDLPLENMFDHIIEALQSYIAVFENLTVTGENAAVTKVLTKAFSIDKDMEKVVNELTSRKESILRCKEKPISVNTLNLDRPHIISSSSSVSENYILSNFVTSYSAQLLTRMINPSKEFKTNSNKIYNGYSESDNQTKHSVILSVGKDSNKLNLNFEEATKYLYGKKLNLRHDLTEEHTDVLYNISDLVSTLESATTTFNSTIAPQINQLTNDIAYFFKNLTNEGKKEIKDDTKELKRTSAQTKKNLKGDSSTVGTNYKSKFYDIIKNLLRLDDYVEADLVPPGQVGLALTTITEVASWIDQNKGKNQLNTDDVTSVKSILNSQKVELQQNIKDKDLTNSEKQAAAKADSIVARLSNKIHYKEQKQQYLNTHYQSEVPDLIQELEKLTKP